MTRFFSMSAGAVAAAVGCQFAMMPARADDIAEFYRGKQVTIIVEAVGGGYGSHGWLITEFMGKHIPGEPKLVMVVRPGAGVVEPDAMG